jgi:hypothetical protein
MVYEPAVPSLASSCRLDVDVATCVSVPTPLTLSSVSASVVVLPSATVDERI